MRDLDLLNTSLDLDRAFALQLAIEDLQVKTNYFEASTAIKRADAYLAWLRGETAKAPQ